MDLPVEYLGENDDSEAEGGYLRNGHPGQITGPNTEDVFVEWAGLEGTAASRWVSYDHQGLGELDEAEHERRVQRLRQGLAGKG